MKRKMTIDVRCTAPGCAAVARAAPYTSPAAKMLTALEGLQKAGWSYQVGFAQMLTGNYQQLCPGHTKGEA